jgi:hypothetical protein
VVEDRKNKAQEEFRGARIRVFGTNQQDPEEGRVFVWTKEGWFERIEGTQGNVAFTPVADSEAELREFISRDSPGADFIQFGGDFRKTVSEEFVEQYSDYRDTPAYSDEEDVDEDEDQEYHQHDL